MTDTEEAGTTGEEPPGTQQVYGFLQPAGVRPTVVLALRNYLRALPGVQSADAHPLLGYLECSVSSAGDDLPDIAHEVKALTGADLVPRLAPVPPRQWVRLAAAVLVHAVALILVAFAPALPAWPALALAGTLSAAGALMLGYPTVVQAWQALRRGILHDGVIAAAGLGLSIFLVPLTWQGYLPPVTLTWPTLLVLTQLASAALTRTLAARLHRRLNAAGIPAHALLPVQQQQDLAEQAARVLPVVALATAAISFAGWWALLPGHPLLPAAASALALFLVCTGDALLLSLPAMTAWGTIAAAVRRIFWHDTATLERLWLTGVAIFSKTSVLTEGRPRISAVIPRAGWTRESVVRLAAAVAEHLGHPAALVVRDEAARLHLDLPAASECEHSSFGMAGTIEGSRVYVGLPTWIEQAGIGLGDLADDNARVQTEGKSSIIVTHNSAAIGLLVITDRLRRDSVSTMRILQRMGIRPAVLTSDSAGTAQTIAEQLGIRHATGDADEARRAKTSQRAQEDTIGVVAQVGRRARGDGPVLPIVFGADAAPQDGVALSGEALADVCAALLLARAIQRTAMFAQVANAIALVALIPAAAFGLMNPGAAAVLALALPAATIWTARRVVAFDPERASARLLRKREMLERL